MRVRTRSFDMGTSVERTLERGRDLGCHFRKRRALTQALGAIQVRGQIHIAELKPGVGAQPPQRFQTSEAVAANAPAVLRIRQTGQRVGDRIEIGRDVQSVNLGIVGGVADDEDAFGRNYARQAIQKTRGAYSARQRHHAPFHAFTAR